MRILVLGGGGSRGALQVGWLRAQTEKGFAADRVIGTSVGAINALHLGHYKPENQARGAEDLEARWVSLRGTGDVLGPRASGAIGALVEGSLYTTKPLEQRLRGWYDAKTFGATPASVGVTAIGSALHRIIPLTTLTDPVRWVLASGSFPLVMPPVKIGNESYRDGGVLRVCPVVDALSIQGVSEIDAVCCSPLRRPIDAMDARLLGAPLHDLARIIEVMSSSVSEGDYHAAKSAWFALPSEQRPVVRWWWPTRAPMDSPMDFDAHGIERAIAAGYDLGRGSPQEEWRTVA